MVERDSEDRRIVVYVRKDSTNDGGFKLSFNVPDDIATSRLVFDGIAIDGNSACCSVISFTEDGQTKFLGRLFGPDRAIVEPGYYSLHRSLSDALLATERRLMDLLVKYGYTVEFC